MTLTENALNKGLVNPKLSGYVSEKDGKQKHVSVEEEAQYWRNYYQALKAPLEASRFAVYTYETLCKGKDSEVNLLDLGCGNGRDTYFFASMGVKSVGLDLSATPEERGCKFILGDMATPPAEYVAEADVVYSRFSIHSILATAEDSLIKSLSQHMKVGAKLAIECRSVNDALYGKGKKVEEDCYMGITTHAAAHFRRFVRIEKLCAKLEQAGFKIEEQSESDEYAPYKDDKPVCLRVVATKN